MSNLKTVKSKLKIKKGDKVKILLGKDRGKTGSVERVFIKNGTVLVTGLNIYKKHTKPRGQGQQSQGGIIDISRPLPVEKVALLCPKCNKETKVGYQISGDDKFRICRKCKSVI